MARTIVAAKETVSRHTRFLSSPALCMSLFLSGCISPAPETRVLPLEHQLLPYTETIPGTLVKFDMVPISGGTVSLRDTTVAIRPFWMGKAEVTWDEYDVYALELDLTANQGAGEKPVDAITRPSKSYIPPDRGFGHSGYPALGMTFHAATQYCRWLSAMTGKKYRLPTEAEWTYACQVDTTSLDAIAWYRDNADYEPKPVAQKQPNARGLFDMLGNVSEWCTDGRGTPVACGGSYEDEAPGVHCGARAYQTPEWNDTDPQIPKSPWWLSDAAFVGLRIVREP